MTHKIPRVVASALSLLWLFAVVAFYYVAHKPFTLSNLAALGQAAMGLGGAALVVALGTGIGMALLRRLDLAPLERLVWATAVGLGAVSLTGLALGALGLLRPWLLWLLTAGGLAATGLPLARSLRAARADSSWRPQSRFERFLAVYCGLMLAVALAWALAPPTAWDGLVYHLTGPKLYLATGSVSHPLDLPYLGFPQLVEMLFAWGMGLVGERAAAPIHWFYGLLAVLGLVAAGRQWLGGVAGWLAAAILLSASSIVMLIGWPYVDLALLFYTTLAFLALARFWQGGWARSWLVLSGGFAGLALSTKYTALALLPALTVTLLVARVSGCGSRSRRLRSVACDVLLMCGLALATWVPWLVRNWLLTGNPTYPFFFGGVYWDDWRAWWYDRPGTGLLYSAPWRLLVAPWDVTVWGVEGGAGYGATIGPLFLALVPLLPWACRELPLARRRWLWTAAAFCGVLYGFWLWGVARSTLLFQSRLFFLAFGLLALVAAAAVEGLLMLPRRPLDLAWLVRTIVVGVLALTLAGTLLPTMQERPLPVLLGFESRDSFLTRRLGWYHLAVAYINRELPPDAVVLFLWEPRTYHCQVACWPDALLDRWLHTVHVIGHDAQAVADAWQAEGVTHVLFYRRGYEMVREAGFDPLTPADVVTLETVQSQSLQVVQDFDGVYTLYSLVER